MHRARARSAFCLSQFARAPRLCPPVPLPPARLQVIYFHSIPFASPPVGDLRFAVRVALSSYFNHVVFVCASSCVFARGRSPAPCVWALLRMCVPVRAHLRHPPGRCAGLLSLSIGLCVYVSVRCALCVSVLLCMGVNTCVCYPCVRWPLCRDCPCLPAQPPAPPASWSGVKDVTALPALCPQIKLLDIDILGSEDCLYLHVYVPRHDPDVALPVMFWSKCACVLLLVLCVS